MGQKLIDENNPHEPSKRSRLQDSKDVYPRLTRNTGTEEIQKIQFSSAGDRSNSKITFPNASSFEIFATNFPGDSLILLDLSRSNIRQLWKGNKSLGNLKVMNLSYCQNLVKISKFPSMPALKILRLKGCKKLRSLPSSICELKCLECLWCSGCSNLEAFPEITEKMENLKELHLDETAIKELPSSIYHLTALEFLNLEHCKNLVSLPSGIKLEHLDLSFCNDLVSFPAINSQLCGLRFLGLSHCKRLQSHPELQSSIERAFWVLFYARSMFLSILASGHESENTFDDISQNEYAHTSKNESEDEFENSPVDATRTCRLECKLTDQIGEVDFLAFGPTLCEYYFNGGPSKQVWIRYYPKVKECGVYLIYARSDQHYNLLAESLDDAGSIVVESDSFDVGCKTLRSLPSSICELKCLEHQVFWLFKPREELESRSCLSCPENDPFSNVTRGFNILTSGSQAILKWFVYVQLDAESCHEFEKQSENKFNDKSQKEYAHTPKNESDDEFESSPIDATCTYCLECKLTDQIGGVDFLAFAPPLCECYFNGGSSKQVWIRYYPKVALKKKYLSNEWGHLTASFKGYHSGIPLKVKECGVHLIYA
ncbi:putative disease resistance protein RPP1 [Vitis vinifera]|uniref:Putative disease resistance protein RPP1 n=1 Tax=Vitis vinifera TaxID=29760 RepID=A0A438HEM5_VITVI|nr:putative disease resistance protein RPP1 [Vitis vinifera]